MSKAAVAVFSTPEAVAEMAFSPPETVFSPADTALMPLLARTNAVIPLASGMMLSAWADT